MPKSRRRGRLEHRGRIISREHAPIPLAVAIDASGRADCVFPSRERLFKMKQGGRLYNPLHTPGLSPVQIPPQENVSCYPSPHPTLTFSWMLPDDRNKPSFSRDSAALPHPRPPTSVVPRLKDGDPGRRCNPSRHSSSARLSPSPLGSRKRKRKRKKASS
ncbi:hypothetical protein LZ30DRAFT_718393 [Colletotrichum cereale]|nr:hypothetical protein LZ30DRAFT_718393 [Colletotrichum cereale]